MIDENAGERTMATKEFDLDVYAKEWNRSFKYTFVDPKDLNDNERTVWSQTSLILRLGGGKPSSVREIRISETMRPDSGSLQEALGRWDSLEGRIVVKRTQLSTVASFAGTLLHELVHARGAEDDHSSEFVEGLTEMLGTVTHNANR
jgi:hypothetical protein